MSTPKDVAYLVDLLVNCQRSSEQMGDGQAFTTQEDYTGYAAWATGLSYELKIEIGMLTAVTSLGCITYMQPVNKGFHVDEQTLHGLSAMAFRFDTGPWRRPAFLGGFASWDAVQAMTILKACSDGRYLDAKAHLAALGMSGWSTAMSGSLDQTLFVLLRLLFHVVMLPSGVPEPAIELRATSMRAVFFTVREVMRAKEWCTSCSMHVMELASLLDDDNRMRYSTEERKPTEDSSWVEEMKRKLEDEA